MKIRVFLRQNMSESYHHLRRNYGKFELNESNLPENPFDLFRAWFDQAIADKLPDANAMVLSTAAAGRSASRIVLLKDIAGEKLVFFTNYQSRKGQEIAHNAMVSVLFFWPQHERQIRIEGKASKISRVLSEQYFASRPPESQAAAAASHQSEKIKDKSELSEKYNSLLSEGKQIACPVHWGGYGIAPDYFEFWQGGLHRLHDRIVYEKQAQSWVISRLSP